MPKQHRNRALLVKPTSSAPPHLKTSGTIVAPVNDDLKPRSVNELLHEARRARRYENGLLGSQLASSLFIPLPSRSTIDRLPRDVNTPERAPTRVRRIPGPPPPRSWLEDSQHAPNSSSAFHELRWARARVQEPPATLPGAHFPRPTSLLHAALKSVAVNWSWHASHNAVWLPAVPESIRETLLNYISIYDDHQTNPMPILFPADCEKKELDNITRLELSNALGAWASMKKIEKELVVKPEVPNTEQNSKHAMTVPDSWDTEEESTSFLSASQPVLRFSNLKHLSLSVNVCALGAAPSWQGLLAVAPHLSRLTSLSLANWSRPTYTPNASRHYVRVSDTTRGSAPSVTYGGTNYYSTYDDDWQEAVGILKSLSRHLHALTWLDLSGCGEWHSALTWHGAVGDGMEHYVSSIDWNGPWRNIRTLILMVGWLPGDPSSPQYGSSSYSTSSVDSTKAIEQLYGNSERIQESLTKISALRLEPQMDSISEERWNVEREREKAYYRRDVARYREIRNSAQTQARKIRQLRTEGGGGWIDVEFGQVLADTDTET